MKITARNVSMVLCFSTFTIFAQKFTLNSKEFVDSTASLIHFFNGFDCIGFNESPSLFWKNPPKKTKSFAITIKDLDYKSVNEGWWHWIVFDIPKYKRSLPHDFGNEFSTYKKRKTIKQHKTDFGTFGYGGPCPPKGNNKHRYEIKIYALDKKNLDIHPDGNISTIIQVIDSHTLSKSIFIFYAVRK